MLVSVLELLDNAMTNSCHVYHPFEVLKVRGKIPQMSVHETRSER
jgi:hypothetical protein